MGQLKMIRGPTELFWHNPVSSEISDLLLFVSYFASQNKEMKFGNHFLMCVVQIKTYWLDVRYPQQAVVLE